MLVLRRKLKQSVKLHTSGGDTITILFMDADKGGATIGIDAPRTVRIVRGELVDKLAFRALDEMSDSQTIVRNYTGEETMATIGEFNRAAEHAPKLKVPSLGQLKGWILADGSVVCVECAVRVEARGCGNALREAHPIWTPNFEADSCQCEFHQASAVVKAGGA